MNSGVYLLLYAVVASVVAVSFGRCLYREVGVRDVYTDADLKYARYDHLTIWVCSVLLGIFWPITFYYLLRRKWREYKGAPSLQ